MRLGAVILAGGQGTRPKERNKALWKLEGRTFLEQIALQLSHFNELLLSVDEAGPFLDCGLKIVRDIYRGYGAISGLHSALRQCTSDALFVVPCDMPLFKKELADYVLQFVNGEYEAYIVTTSEGELVPLCGVYTKSCAAKMQRQIAKKDYSLQGLLQTISVRKIPLTYTCFGDEVVSTISTPTQYRQMQNMMFGPPVVAITGAHGAGKTKVLQKVLPLLAGYGVNAGVIKENTEEFKAAAEGEDVNLLAEAGANPVGAYSAGRYMVTQEFEDIDIQMLLPFFWHNDVVLLEGGDTSPYAKIELAAAEEQGRPVCEDGTLLAFCAPKPDPEWEGKLLGHDDYEEIAEFIARFVLGEDFEAEVREAKPEEEPAPVKPVAAPRPEQKTENELQNDAMPPPAVNS